MAMNGNPDQKFFGGQLWEMLRSVEGVALRIEGIQDRICAAREAMHGGDMEYADEMMREAIRVCRLDSYSSRSMLERSTDPVYKHSWKKDVVDLCSPCHVSLADDHEEVVVKPLPSEGSTRMRMRCYLCSNRPSKHTVMYSGEIHERRFSVPKIG